MEKNLETINRFWNEENIAKYEKAMAVVISEIQNIDKAYYKKNKSHCIRFLEKRLKTADSILQKLERKNKKNVDMPLEEIISDLAGVRVICFDIDQIYMLAKKIEKRKKFEIIKVKDYVHKPKDNGYQSYHIIIGVEGVKVELQIRTILMDAWSSMDSIVVYKKSTPISDEMKSDIQKFARWSRKMDKMVARILSFQC